MADLIDRDALLKDMGLTDAVKYGNKDAEQQYRSYSTWMSYEIADAILDAPAVNRWIPCSERFPEREKDVLVFYPRWHDDMFSESGIVVAQLMYDGLTWDICGEFNPGLHAITHWMPLPEPPEKE